ncbi:MAG: mannose-1-phosphate guanylyltransferase [Oligoflexia bacterium]|nr:mannose-1-phosphate guanylyltransferase [Oligoflexia bacterium]
MNDLNLNYYALIMAGGSGRRFWPESTKDHPKQYLNLAGEKTLLEDTLLRFEGLVESKRRFIVTVKEQESLAKKFSISKDLIGEKNLILEPLARNTAPCIFLSLVEIIRSGASPKDLLVIVPSDHVILNSDAFKSDIKRALQIAHDHSSIVTIGIKPTFPHTGYGYIKSSNSKSNSNRSYKVEEFKEKPNFEVAKDYISKGYFWNAGMFVASVGTLMREFETHAPEIYRFYNSSSSSSFCSKKVSEEYQNMPSISVDCAILEKSKCVDLIAATFDWSDLGSWETLSDVCKDRDVKNGNYLVSNNQRFFVDDKSKDNIVRVNKERLVVLLGVKDLIVVDDGKSLVIMDKKSTQEIKGVVEHLEKCEWGKEYI